MDHGHYRGVWLGLVAMQALLIASAFNVRRARRTVARARLSHEAWAPYPPGAGILRDHVRAVFRAEAGAVLDRAGPALAVHERAHREALAHLLYGVRRRRRLRAADRRDRHRQDHGVPLLPGAGAGALQPRLHLQSQAHGASSCCRRCATSSASQVPRRIAGAAPTVKDYLDPLNAFLLRLARRRAATTCWSSTRRRTSRPTCWSSCAC